MSNIADQLRSNFGVLNDRQEAFSSGLEAVETSLGEVGGRVEALENISDQIQARLAAEIEKLDKVDADFSSQLSDFQKVKLLTILSAFLF